MMQNLASENPLNNSKSIQATWPPRPAGLEQVEPPINTSGTDGPIPEAVEPAKFNWGAFGSNWI